MSNLDPAAATAAYLGVLSPAAHAKATAYTQGGHWLLLWSWLISVAVALLILKSGVLRRLGARLQATSARPKLFAFIAAVTFSVIDFVIELPWTSYAAWGREKSYGLTHQSWPGWLGEQIEMMLISALLTGLLVIIVYTLIRRLPRSWWAWSGAVVALFFIVGLVLSPVLLEPLFNTYTAAPPGPVRDAVVRMATAVGVPHDKIFVYNGSKQSDRYTANVSGLAGSARVAMSDTMFKQGADLAEVRGVVGHEMGHYVLQHALMSAAAFSLIALLVLWLVQLLEKGVFVFKMLFLVALALGGSAVAAATITYDVSQKIGLGSVMGTIQTDGAFGALNQSDVVGFDLIVSGPGASVEVTQADSVVVIQGSNFSANASNLLFDYSGASGFLLFQQGSFGTGLKYYCSSSVSDTCFQGASAVPEAYNSPSAQVEARVGNQIIASVAGAVPEPSSWALMIAGFGMVGVFMRRKGTTRTYA